MYIHLTDSEHATVLAALTYWRMNGMGDPGRRCLEVHQLATNDDAVISLDDEGVAQLCERLQTPPGISSLEPGPLSSVRVALVSLLHLTPADRARLQDGTFAVCAADPEEENSCFFVLARAAVDSPAESFPGASPEFLAICRQAVDDECDLVRFDVAGETYAGLARFDAELLTK